MCLMSCQFNSVLQNPHMKVFLFPELQEVKDFTFMFVAAHPNFMKLFVFSLCWGLPAPSSEPPDINSNGNTGLTNWPLLLRRN